MKSCIGISGIASTEEAHRTIDAWKDAWSGDGRPCAFDLAMKTFASAGTLRGDAPSPGSCTPRREDLSGCLVRTGGVVNIVRYAGDFSPDGEGDEIRELARWSGTWWDGFQFDGRWPSPEAVGWLVGTYVAPPRASGCRVIFRVDVSQAIKGEDLQPSPEAIVQEIARYQGLVTDVIVDGSRSPGAPATPEERACMVRYLGALSNAGVTPPAAHAPSPLRGIGLGVACDVSVGTLHDNFTTYGMDPSFPWLRWVLPWARLVQVGTSIDAWELLRDGERIDPSAVRAYFDAAKALSAEAGELARREWRMAATDALMGHSFIVGAAAGIEGKGEAGGDERGS